MFRTSVIHFCLFKNIGCEIIGKKKSKRSPDGCRILTVYKIFLFFFNLQDSRGLDPCGSSGPVRGAGADLRSEAAERSSAGGNAQTGVRPRLSSVR